MVLLFMARLKYAGSMPAVTQESGSLQRRLWLHKNAINLQENGQFQQSLLRTQRLLKIGQRLVKSNNLPGQTTGERKWTNRTPTRFNGPLLGLLPLPQPFPASP